MTTHHESIRTLEPARKRAWQRDARAAFLFSVSCIVAAIVGGLVYLFYSNKE